VALTVPAPARPAIFLDKDGTLIEDVPYNVDPARLVFTAGALPALALLAEAGYALVVVTNQPGLASGRFSRSDFALLERALMRRVLDEAGVDIAAVYACPHAPAVGRSPACLCRKPAPGLLRRASLEQRLDLTRSWMVGDILDDIEAGRRAGCRTVLLDVGHETLWRLSPLRTPHHRCRDLFEAAQLIVEVQSDRFDAPPRGITAPASSAATAPHERAMGPRLRGDDDRAAKPMGAMT
jgi:D-glycero-D-manno-heptose 1,7-bisphosphate phosphatase